MAAVRARHGVSSMVAVVVAPRALDDAVDEERVEGVRRPDAEDPRAILLAQDDGPAGVDEQQGLPRADEPDDRRIAVVVSGWGAAVWQVDEHLAVLGAEPAQRQALERRGDVARRHPRPQGDLVDRRRPEAGRGSDARGGPWRRSSSRSGSGTDPRLGERVQIGPAALPRPRRRDPDEIEERADAVEQARAGDGVELLAGELPVLLERRPHPHPRRPRMSAVSITPPCVRSHHSRRGPADRPVQRPVVGRPRRGGSSSASAWPGRPAAARGRP